MGVYRNVVNKYNGFFSIKKVVYIKYFVESGKL